ncbi:hypothetical protein D1007_25400 [Hordeum vulgare]|nr:hypothetical protein D1007_25400 [Hordeum vulgare]
MPPCPVARQGSCTQLGCSPLLEGAGQYRPMAKVEVNDGSPRTGVPATRRGRRPRRCKGFVNQFDDSKYLYLLFAEKHVLSHYQIRALHLDPRSLVLLSTFAFLCVDFVGVTPSMELLCHFFSLELVSEVQCSGCASFKAVDPTVPGDLYAELLPEAEGFSRHLVWVEAAEAGALFQSPPAPATPNRGWEREELSDPRLASVLIQLEKLRHAGLIMVMVVREFICQRLLLFSATPAQCGPT